LHWETNSCNSSTTRQMNSRLHCPSKRQRPWKTKPRHPGPRTPKAAQFDKDKYDRSRNTGCKATATSKKAVSQSTTAKAKQMKAIDRAHKPAPAAAKSTNPPADANCTLVLEEGDDELQMTNRRTGEAT
jgi:hypothetical protein